MNIEEFTKAIADKIKEKNENLIVEANTNIKKNNGLVLAGISIRNEDTNIAPIIYTNSMFNHELSVEEAVDQVLDIYDSHKDDMSSFKAEDVQTFDNIKDKIVAKVINKERNNELINACPYAQFGDLAIVFSIIVSEESTGIASIKITNELMNTWKINLAQLIEIAYQNTKQIFPMEVIEMGEIIKQMMGNVDPEMAQALECPDNVMYVVSNRTRQNGAYFITDRECLIDIASQINSKKFFILPSSIHELIIVPTDNVDENYDQLLSMVTEVNQTQVSPDEVLADNVYVFDADLEELRTIGGTIIPFIA